jgi:hypothetical protein
VRGDDAGSSTSNGSHIQLYTCNGTASQQWQANSAGELVNPRSGLCLDDPGGTSTDKTQLQIYHCVGGTAQTWTLPR